MTLKPDYQFVPVDPASSHPEHHSFLLIDGGPQAQAIEAQESIHSSMPGALVAVDEGVVLDEGKAESGGLVDEGRVQILAAKSHPRLRQSGFECTFVSHPGRAARVGDDELVKEENFLHGKMSHQARRR